MTPEKIDTITDAACIQRVRAAAIEAKFIEQRSFQRVGNYLELTPDDMHKCLAKEFYRIVTKLLQTREERVDAENACAKEALISAAEFAARQTFARKRRTPVKIVWSLAELSQQCVSSDFAPSNAVAQLRKNKINSWAHTFTIDSGKIEISIVMTPSSITFITTKVA